MKIAVADTGYVGLSIATLLAQHNEVTAVDVIPEKVDLINNHKSPIQDEYIEKYLARKNSTSRPPLTARPPIKMLNSWSLQHLPTMTPRRTFSTPAMLRK